MLTAIAYRIAHGFANISTLPADSRDVYHKLNPHPALTPVPDERDPSSMQDQAKAEASYRQLLVQGALAILLPTEDLDNACLRTLVADVIAEPILCNSIGGKICEGWFLWSSITRLIEAVHARTKPDAVDPEIDAGTRSRLEKFGLLTEKEEKRGGGKANRQSAFSSAFWSILQNCYLAFITLRFVTFGLFASRSQPARSSTILKPARSAGASPTTSGFQSDFQPRPILSAKIFSLISTISDLPHRMPWLSGLFALLQHHLTQGPLKTVGGTDGILDQ